VGWPESVGWAESSKPSDTPDKWRDAAAAPQLSSAVPAGVHAGAIAEQTGLFEKIDSRGPSDSPPSPPDWMAPSVEKNALAEEVTLLIQLLEL
jgi:hypothetical protein